MDNMDFVDQVEDVHIGVNDEYPTHVQGDTRTAKGLFDTFMQNFAQMSKTMSSIQKEIRSVTCEKSSWTRVVRHLYVRNISYPNITNKVTTNPM